VFHETSLTDSDRPDSTKLGLMNRWLIDVIAVNLKYLTESRLLGKSDNYIV